MFNGGMIQEQHSGLDKTLFRSNLRDALRDRLGEGE